MEGQSSPSFMDLIRLQDVFRRKIYEDLGIPTPTDGLVALSSGLDVALTILEGSGADFEGLSTNGARRVSDYFRSESEKYLDTNVEIGIWYRSWAEAVKAVFLDQNSA